MRENADSDELDEELRPPTKLVISSFSIFVACRGGFVLSEFFTRAIEQLEEG